MARVRLAALICCLALSACGDAPARAPFLESRTPPDLAERFFPPAGWAWGLVGAHGAPLQRYGVSAPYSASQAQVLILTGRGETAEAWFETASDLNARGVTVWVLEGLGQAGSARFLGRRDLVHAPDLGAEATAIHAMRTLVIRPRRGQRFVVLAAGEASPAALRAFETGLAADGLILSSPRLGPARVQGPMEALAVRLGMGRVPAPGWRPWRRDGPDGAALGLTHDAWRGHVQQAWALANSDLRVSGESLAWRAAFARMGRTARDEAAAVRAPALILTPGTPSHATTRLCSALPRCLIRAIAGARPALQLESDAFRGPWLEAAASFALTGTLPASPGGTRGTRPGSSSVGAVHGR